MGLPGAVVGLLLTPAAPARRGARAALVSVSRPPPWAEVGGAPAPAQKWRGQVYTSMSGAVGGGKAVRTETR